MKPLQLLLPKKMERTCAWPTLYLEINGNDDDFESKAVVELVFIINITYIVQSI